MAIVLKRASRLPFAPIVAGVFAGVAGILVAAAPAWMLEQLVDRIGLATVLPAAAAPLGLKARALIAIVSALLAGLTTWAVMIPVEKLLSRPKARPFEVAPLQPMPVTDAPASMAGFNRPPIFADRELGAPFMSDEALAVAPIERAEDADSPVIDAADDELVLDGGLMQPEDQIFARPAPLVIPPAPQEEAQEPVVSDVVHELPQRIVAAPVPPPADEASGDTVAKLMARLEHGLERRARAHTETTAPPLAQAQHEMDSALRQALGTLERLAGAGR
jgi:hypothetical protein